MAQSGTKGQIFQIQDMQCTVQHNTLLSSKLSSGVIVKQTSTCIFKPLFDWKYLVGVTVTAIGYI